MSERSGRDWLLAAALTIATLLAYQPAWHGTPIWDDDAHITKAELRSTDGLIRIWSEPGATQQFYPLVHSVFWVAYRLWGENATGYHLLNILLHAAAALLLVRVLRKLEIPGAWLAAGIFALHPIEVESVAWITELKNTLSGFLYLGAALAYLEFDRGRSRWAYAGALGLFLLGLMAKSVVATLPAALLVVFWWKRGTLSVRRDALPLAPFFVLGIAAGLFTVWMERTFIGASGSEFAFSFVERCLIAGRVFWFYLATLLWPSNLMFIYPRWTIDASVWWQYLYPATAFLTALVCWLLRHRARWPLAALLFYGGTLFPALGFLNVYPFRYSFVADHFQYLAGLAPICLAAAGAARFFPLRLSPFAPLVCAAALLPLGFLSWRQSHIYASYETLWRATLERNPSCWLARNNLGTVLLYKGMFSEAIASYEAAIALKPDYAEAHYNAGTAFSQKGSLPEAITHYRAALRLQPDYPDADLNLGTALAREGRLAEAMACFENAIKSRPAFPAAHYNLGIALYQRGHVNGAIQHFQTALASQPDYSEAHRNLAVALVGEGRLAEAISHYEQVVKTHPQKAVVANDLAWLLATGPQQALRNGARAIDLARLAVGNSENANPIALRTLAAALAETGRFSAAAETASRALSSVPPGSPLSAALEHELSLYRAGFPMRDTSFKTRESVPANESVKPQP
jgi:protein O-mannosyl-transferase